MTSPVSIPIDINDGSTEVRCAEEAKGGVKYELVLAEPAVEAPKLTSPPRTDISQELINNKLQAAEERRLSRDAQFSNSWTEKTMRIHEVREKRDEYNNNFIQSTKESLEQKMESNKENRENYLKSIQDKVRIHVMKVEEVKKISDTPPREDVLLSIKKKLEMAAEAREAQMNALQERLREHDRHILEVRKQVDGQVEHLRERLAKKLQVADEKRSALLKEIQEKNKEQERHIMEERKEMEEQDEFLGEQINKKLEDAHVKQQPFIKEIQERSEEHECLVEEARRNANMTDYNENSTG